MATFLGNTADKNLSNLSSLGNARLQCSYGINNGTACQNLGAQDFTVVGTLTYNFSLGEYSGFSGSDYCILRKDFDVSNGKTWEMYWEVTTGTDISTQQYFLGTLGLSSYNDPVIIGLYQSKFYIYLCSSSSVVLGSITGTSTAETGTRYKVELEFTGTAYNLYVNGNLEGTLTSSTSIWTSNLIIGAQSSSSGTINYPWLGSVNLNKSYININGRRWWTSGVYYGNNSTLHTCVGVTGNPTNNNGVFSEFSTTDYLTVHKISFINAHDSGSLFDVTNGETWEMDFEVTTGSNVSTSQYFIGTSTIISSIDPVVIGLYQSKFSFFLGFSQYVNNPSYGVTTVTANTTYTVKLEYTGTEYNLYVNGNLESTLNSTKSIYRGTLAIGVQAGSSTLVSPWLGSVNLNNSYIKVDDELWWDGSLYSKLICDPCTITSSKGVTLADNNTIYYDASERNGTYYVLKRVTDGSIALVSNFVASPTEPTGTKSYWLDTSTVPYTQKRWSSASNEWLDDNVSNSYVCIGSCTISSGLVSALTNFAFNINSEGEWVYRSGTITSSVAYPTSNPNVYDLSNFLPNDSCNYEVLLSTTVSTTTTAGSYTGVKLTSSIITDSVILAYAHTRNTVQNRSTNSIVFPIGIDRKLTVPATSSWTGNYNLIIRGYRRLGLNT